MAFVHVVVDSSELSVFESSLEPCGTLHADAVNVMSVPWVYDSFESLFGIGSSALLAEDCPTAGRIRSMNKRLYPANDDAASTKLTAG